MKFIYVERNLKREKDKILVECLCYKQVHIFLQHNPPPPHQYTITISNLPNIHNFKMASLNTLMFSPAVIPGRKRLPTTKTYATAAKNSSGGSEEKSLWDFVLGAIAKEEQLYEVDPLLQKVEGKSSTSGTGTTGTRKGSVVVPPSKKESGGFGGFGGLFAKKE